MTCIAAVVKDDVIYMGADSYGSNGYAGANYLNPKVFIKDKFIIGCTSTYRSTDLLRYKLNVPKVHPDDEQDPDRYMRTVFIDAVRSCYRDNGLLGLNNNIEEGSTFLIGYSSKLYAVYCDFSVLNVPAYGYSVGSGTIAARASLYTTYSLDMSPEDRINKALESASETVVSVRAPFLVLKLGMNDERKINE